jgi:predicted metal-dependent phosphoesterase TrpH
VAAADFHCHSTYSDGRLRPEALLELAARLGLKILALTDHDTVAGLSEAREAAQKHGIELVSGVEISADFGPGTMHIVGLDFDSGSKAFLGELEKLQQARRDRNPQIFRKLREAGIALEEAEVERLAEGGQVGRPHFAQALLDKGVVKNFEEAFERFLAKGRPAYVPKLRLAPARAIELIHQAGGIAVMAHPVQLGLEGTRLESLLVDLKEKGLDAIEVWHSEHSTEETEAYRILASRIGLGLSGGSDFHGIPDRHVELGQPGIEEALARKLLARSQA